MGDIARSFGVSYHNAYNVVVTNAGSASRDQEVEPATATKLKAADPKALTNALSNAAGPKSSSKAAALAERALESLDHDQLGAYLRSFDQIPALSKQQRVAARVATDEWDKRYPGEIW